MTSVTILTFTFVSLVASSKYSTTIESTTSDDTLRMVHVLFRHGERTPVYLYPNDPWKNKSSEIWPEGLGQLTKVGIKMQYQLGLWLRNRYGLFIKERFDPQEIYVFSTDVDRCLMSAECVLAAFYRPDEDNKFRNDLLWTPTPIHTVPRRDEKLLYVKNNCPKIATELSRIKNLPEFEELTEENEEFLQFLSRMSGLNMNESLSRMMILVDTLLIEKMYNLTLPDWAVKRYDEMEAYAIYYFKSLSYTTELKRLQGGPLLKTMVENMKNKTTGLTERKMLMFSGHDLTVSILLDSMGVYNGIRPPYGATVLVELHEIDKNYFVKMFYQNDTNLINPPHQLRLPGCSPECPLSKWIYILRDIIPEDWDEECNEPDSLVSDEYVSNSKGLSCLSIYTLVLTVLVYFQKVVGEV